MSIEQCFQSQVHAPSERVLAIFPGALGDFICFLPALERLARSRQVDLFARAEYGEIVPVTVRTRSLECREISRLFTPEAKRDDQLKSFFADYASVYSWMGSGQREFVDNLSLLARGKLQVFPFRPADSRRHMTDYYLSCLGENPSPETSSRITLRENLLRWGMAYWQERGFPTKRVLALAPGSGAREKNWPADFFAAIADWWRRSLDGRVLIILGPVEAEQSEQARFRKCGLVVQNEGLGCVAALLSRCDLYLGNDSGITHLAAALRVSTVALFGPTDSAQWAPRRKQVTVISRNVECSPCSDRVMKSCWHRMCLTGLNPERVIAKLGELVQRVGRHGDRILDKVGCED